MAVGQKCFELKHKITPHEGYDNVVKSAVYETHRCKLKRNAASKHCRIRGAPVHDVFVTLSLGGAQEIIADKKLQH